MSDIGAAKRPLGELTYRIRVRYKNGERDSCWMSGGDLGTIFAASDRAVAECRARQMADDHEDATYHVVPFRTAAKAPPPRMVDLETTNRVVIRVYPEDIVRAAKESK